MKNHENFISGGIKLSFIVPAHNEERWIGKCLASIQATMRILGEPYEVIVVDDASTDSTRGIAERMGARTVRVEHRKISAGHHDCGGDQPEN